MKKVLKLFLTQEEDTFWSFYYSSSLRSVRYALSLAFILYGLFGLLDLYMAPFSYKSIWIIRFAFVMPVVGISFALTWSRFFVKLSQAVLLAVLLFGAGGILLMIGIVDKNEPAYEFYYSGLILAIIWANGILRLKSSWALVVCSIVVILYNLIIVYFRNDYQSSDVIVLINNNFFLIGVLIIGGWSSSTTEAMFKRDFINNVATTIKALRSQVSPHFFFNSLNSINYFVLEAKPIEASDYLAKFSKMIRLFLDVLNDDYVHLSKETQIITQYLELERVRFTSQFQFRVEVSEDIDTDRTLLPSMIIQPFIEETIVQNICSIENGSIFVRFFIREGKLICIVEDNGMEFKEVDGTTSKVINLNRQRLSLMQPKSGFRVAKLEGAHGSTNITEFKFDLILDPKRSISFFK